MSKLSSIIFVALCFLSSSSYLGCGGGIGCCVATPLHLSSPPISSPPNLPPAPHPEIPGDFVDLLPNVVWPWIASAKHVALTFGSHFIFTFDGRLYRLPKSLLPDCRHTLMRDRSSDRISTLIGNLNSLTIIAKQLTISIDEHYQVKANNTKLIRDLPLTSWDGRILVSREGSWLSVESFDGGYMTTCSPTANICLVILSNDYEGNSIGLLGTNDGNSSNDFMLRNGRQSDNMRNFINSYEVTGMTHCLNSSVEDNTTGRRYITDNDDDDDDDDEEEDDDDERTAQEQDEENEQRTCEMKYVSACRDLFKSQRSTMAECYSKIDPLPFLNACLDLMETCSSRPQMSGRLTNITTDNAFCSIAFSYSLLCGLRPSHSNASSSANINISSSIHRDNNNASQILLRIPSGCRGCSSASSDITQSLQPTRQKVDLVVIVTGLKSNKNQTSGYRIGQALKHLLHELRESLRTDHSIHDLRIGLITHDDRSRPLSHTLKGLLFGTTHSHSSLESRLISLDTNPGSASFPTAAAASASSSFHTQYTTIDALRLALKYPMRSLAVKQLMIVSTSANHTETDDLQQISQESLARGIQMNLWSSSATQNNTSSLHRLVEATNGSVFHVTRTSRQSNGAILRQMSRRLTQQIVSRMRQCQRCSNTCSSSIGILDDLHCQPVQDGPC